MMYRIKVGLVWAIIIIIIIIIIAAAHDAEADGMMITKPGCNQTCVNSDVVIPYPFGIGSNCYHKSSEHYEIVCKPPSSSNSSGAFKPFLRKLDIQVFRINFEYDYYGNSVLTTAAGSDSKLYIASEKQQICSNNSSIIKKSLIGSPFYFSDVDQFMVQGCAGRVRIRDGTGSLIGGCSVFCQDNNTTNINNINYTTSSCDGVGCCLINMAVTYTQYLEIELTTTNNTTNSCVNVSYIETSSYEVADYGGDDSGISSIVELSSQTLWDWMAPQINVTHSSALNPHQNRSLFCDTFSCTCKLGFHGNPYLPFGCQAISGLSPGQKKAMILGLSISLGILSMGFIVYGLFRVIQRWRQIKRKSINFKRNGGLLLQQQTTTTTTRDNMVDTIKIFSDAELEKATDNFNANRILGQGGQGTVYKGMLLDGRVVAVKKALNVDESQIEQFINEVVILSEIRHRNIVKLLGCCLETEVPLLVYEFIPNGTLSQHIHNLSEEFYITWKMRLEIAAESAGALTYLHSASATPIYHRDIKSSNILLDEKFRAKVADFGTSRTFQIDQTHLTTLVQGTLGYMDPEYFQTNQFTEKSDVYSFGVVLVELLTSQKPLSTMPSGGWKSLTREFLSHMESSCLFDIIDSRILVEANKEELFAMANLAMKCLNLNGKHRPTMKEVANVLESIKPTTLQIAGEQTYSKAKNETMEINVRVA